MDSEVDASYVDFLQDQVKRLNAVLQEYQQKYLPVKEPVIGDEPLPPWVTNESIVTPLLTEYDSKVKSLQEQVTFYKRELELLRKKANQIVEENSRLHEELRLNIETQMNAARVGGTGNVPGLEKEMLENVQHQLELLTKEKESYIEMWQNATMELEKLQEFDRDRNLEQRHTVSEVAALQADLQKARHFAEELQVLNQKLKAEHQQFLSTAQTQDQEIDNARAELRKCKCELKATKTRNEELKNTLELLRNQIKSREREGSEEEHSADSKVQVLQTLVLELESRMGATVKEAGRLRSENTELEERLTSLKRKNAEQEQREYEAMAHVRDSVQLVENAILERDQILVREQQKAQEVARLQEVISKLLREAGKRTRAEVDNVRNQCNKNIQQLMEEMHLLEMEGAEKQAQLERAMREKAAVEKELEKLYQDGPSEIERAGMNAEELQRRISHAERARDEASMKFDVVNSALKRQEAKFEQERAQTMSENEALRRRVKELERETEDVTENRLQLVDEIDKLKRKVQAATQGKETAEHQCTMEVAALKQQHELKEKEFESRLKNVEQMHQQSVNELRDMLSRQQRVGTEWKEESKTLAQKFEHTVTELRHEIGKQKKRNEEISLQLLEARKREEQVESKLAVAKQHMEKLERVATDAETRADAASIQVTTLLNRERQLLHERKSMNRELEKVKLERSRPNGARIREPPQRLSDLLPDPTQGNSGMHEPPVQLDLMSPRGYRGVLNGGELDGIRSRDDNRWLGSARNRIVF